VKESEESVAPTVLCHFFSKNHGLAGLLPSGIGGRQLPL